MATRKKITSMQRFTHSLARIAAATNARTGGAGLVALVALYTSYWHISAMALDAGQRVDIAYLSPLAVDGLMLVAGAYAMAPRMTHATRMTAYLFFALGWVASLVANIQSAGAGASTWHQSVAAWPAIATLGTALVLHLGSHKPARKAAKTPVPAQTHVSASAPVPTNGYRPQIAYMPNRLVEAAR